MCMMLCHTWQGLLRFCGIIWARLGRLVQTARKLLLLLHRCKVHSSLCPFVTSAAPSPAAGKTRHPSQATPQTPSHRRPRASTEAKPQPPTPPWNPSTWTTPQTSPHTPVPSRMASPQLHLPPLGSPHQLPARLRDLELRDRPHRVQPHQRGCCRVLACPEKPPRLRAAPKAPRHGR